MKNIEHDEPLYGLDSEYNISKGYNKKIGIAYHPDWTLGLLVKYEHGFAYYLKGEVNSNIVRANPSQD